MELLRPICLHHSYVAAVLEWLALCCWKHSFVQHRSHCEPSEHSCGCGRLYHLLQNIAQPACYTQCGMQLAGCVNLLTLCSAVHVWGHKANTEPRHAAAHLICEALCALRTQTGSLSLLKDGCCVVGVTFCPSAPFIIHTAIGVWGSHTRTIAWHAWAVEPLCYSRCVMGCTEVWVD